MAEVSAALHDLLEAFGGLQAFVKPGMKVLLKPNMLSKREPDAAATTHPVLLEAVAAKCKELGAEVWIGDSPPLIQGSVQDFWEKTGFRRVAENTKSKLIHLEAEPTQKIVLQMPYQLVQVGVSKRYFAADIVINLPKLKTHNLTRLTGAVKNLFGLLPGLQKACLHRDFPRPQEFAQLLARLAQALPVQLTIIDAISAMDGRGPAGGRVVWPKKLLAATHPVTADLGVCMIAGANPATIPTLQACHLISFGPSSTDQLAIVGESYNQMQYSDFNVPPTPFLDKLPKSLLKIAKKLIWMRPVIQEKSCIQCQACVKICPMKCISLRNPAIRFNYSNCISCFCCMEVCPKDAINMGTSRLIQLVFAVRKIKRLLQGKRS